MVAKSFRTALVVGDRDKGIPGLFVLLIKQVDQFCEARLILAHSGFIQKQDVRFGGDDRRDGQPPLLPF